MIQKVSESLPLYILVSNRTSSAAEAFAYTLQSFKRATIVGDTTNGEANPGYAFAINDEMWIMIPTSINRDAIRKTNWQGVGVIPDEKIDREQALAAAQATAYKQLSLRSSDSNARNMYDWLSTGCMAKAYPVKADERQFQSFVGEYADNRKISFDQQSLFYERVGFSEKKKLLPLAKNLFELDGAPYFRVQFVKDNQGKTVALEGIYDDGKKELSRKK
jgi:SLT domain-containing protein